MLKVEKKDFDERLFKVDKKDFDERLLSVDKKDFDEKLFKDDKKDFDERLLNVDKKDYNDIDIYYIGYVNVNKIDNCNNVFSVNPLYLMIDEMIGHFDEKNENKYLVSNDVDESKEDSKKYEEVWEGVKKEIETINGGEKLEYGKRYVKIRLKSNDDLPLNKPIKLRLLTIIIRSIFSKDNKFYPELFLDAALNE